MRRAGKVIEKLTEAQARPPVQAWPSIGGPTTISTRPNRPARYFTANNLQTYGTPSVYNGRAAMGGRAGMGRQARFSDQEYREIAEFRVALSDFLHRADGRAREEGVTPQRYLLLLSVRGHSTYPAVTVSQVSDALKIRQSSASLLVDRAVRDGYLNRVADTEDRRRVHLSLTESGQQLLDTIVAANRQDLGRLNWAQFGANLRQAMEFQLDDAANS